MSYIAFYFFYRWNIVREPPPRFQQRQQWYNIYLFRGDKVKKPLSYETQLDWISKVFKGVNLVSLKKTHKGRAEGAKQAEINSVAEGRFVVPDDGIMTL